MVFFTRQSLPSATYWLCLVVVTKLFFRFRSERQVDVACWARGAADVVHRISGCLSFDHLIGKIDRLFPLSCLLGTVWRMLVSPHHFVLDVPFRWSILSNLFSSFVNLWWVFQSMRVREVSE